jgi:hypothetical protein
MCVQCVNLRTSAKTRGRHFRSRSLLRQNFDVALQIFQLTGFNVTCLASRYFSGGYAVLRPPPRIFWARTVPDLETVQTCFLILPTTLAVELKKEIRSRYR